MKINILIVTVAYIIGILLGLYIANICIALLLCLGFSAILIVLNCVINKSLDMKKIVIFMSMVIFIISISVCRTKYTKNKFDKLYEGMKNGTVHGMVVNLDSESEFYSTYRIRVKSINGERKYNNTLILAKFKKNKSNVQIGDKLLIEGTFIQPASQRNYHGFDYKKYLNSNNIYSIMKVAEIKKIEDKKFNVYKIKNLAIKNTCKVLSGRDNGISLALIFGYKVGITEDVRNNFDEAGVMHLLAISGLHVSYISLGLNTILRKFNKKYSGCFIILVLILYIILTGESVCVIRACIMEIMSIISNILHRKSNSYINLIFSALVILILNPIALTNVGFIFSYMGVLGIILLLPYINKVVDLFEIILCGSLLKEIGKDTNSIRLFFSGGYLYIKKVMNVTISSYIFLLPVSMYFYHAISPLFLLSSIITSPMIPLVILASAIQILASTINLKIGTVIANITIIFFEGFNNVIAFIGSINFSKIYLSSPGFVYIVLYYVCILFCIVRLKKKEIQIVWIVTSYIKIYVKKTVVLFIIIVIIFTSIIIKSIPGDLYIYFIDVGQGDSCLIVTPNHKTILIDGGGSEEYDIGKNTLIPYLLARGINKLDYILISHFDTDHVRTDY